MYRIIFNELSLWKKSKKRKPLILQGARQVGKTWVMKEFGKREFKKTVYLNFESSTRIKNMFVADFEIDRIMQIIEIESGEKIIPATTLIIFDEIQEAEKGIIALKYFYENAPQYYIIAAGSLLGVALQKNNSFPIGKVDLFKIFPMNFFEFLMAGGNEKLLELLVAKKWNIIESYHDFLVDQLRLYYFIGGMPEAVAEYFDSKNLKEVRKIQEKILNGYESDFYKHTPKEIVPRIRMVWNGILGQLAKENKKFFFGQIKSGARSKEFEIAIQWLTDAGLLIKVNRINNGKIPLKSYCQQEMFKLFLHDVGLLNAMTGLPAELVLEKNTILTEYKGALTEQFVCQELYQHYVPYYWSPENARAEVDFVIQREKEIIPIEVKAEENLKSKSLGVFAEKYQIKKPIRASMNKYRKESWMENVPLYAVGNL